MSDTAESVPVYVTARKKVIKGDEGWDPNLPGNIVNTASATAWSKAQIQKAAKLDVKHKDGISYTNWHTIHGWPEEDHDCWMQTTQFATSLAWCPCGANTSFDSDGSRVWKNKNSLRPKPPLPAPRVSFWSQLKKAWRDVTGITARELEVKETAKRLERERAEEEARQILERTDLSKPFKVNGNGWKD